MQIQVALDRLTLERAVQVTVDISPLVDWIEVGTSLVKQYGIAGLREVLDAAGTTPVLADLKTVDDVEFELTLAYDAGARSVTVLGLAPAVTLERAVRVAAERNRELVVDLLGMDADQTSALARRVPPTVRLSAHVGKDAQGNGARAEDMLGPWAHTHPVAVAGGLTGADLPGLAHLPDARAIVGSAVTGANDPSEAVRVLRTAAGLDGTQGPDDLP